VKAGRPGGKSTRRRARELALMGLYQHFVGGADAATIDSQMREQPSFASCDEAHFKALVQGCIDEAVALDAAVAHHADRKTSALSPIEHGALWIGAWELMHCIDIPYKVVINEAVELTKAFGGTDGHKYVNGVLDKAAAELRPEEVQAARAARRVAT
jgi:transcription antitermination protein NusB